MNAAAARRIVHIARAEHIPGMLRLLEESSTSREHSIELLLLEESSASQEQRTRILLMIEESSRVR
jgi:hypothetical protein